MDTVDKVNDAAEVAESAEKSAVRDDGRNVMLTGEYSTPLDQAKNVKDETVALPTAGAKAIVEILDSMPNVKMADNEEKRKWANILADSLDHIYLKDSMDDAANDTTRAWRQGLECNGKMLSDGTPRLKHVENSTLSGESGAMRVLSGLGLGGRQQTALWNSGFWVTIKPPSEDSILELYRLLTDDKITLGRATHGLVFSNFSVVTYDRVLDFCLEHVYSTSVEGVTDLKSIISTHDLYPLILCLINTWYLDGFRYSRACITDPSKCTHVVEEVISGKRIHKVDQNSICKDNLLHMSNRASKSMSLESVEKYKERLHRAKGKRVCISKENELYFNLKVPSVKEYLQHGTEWVNGISNTINGVLTDTDDVNKRNTLIDNASKTMLMCQYGHFVESVEYGTNNIVDAGTIKELLTGLSVDATYLSTFLEEVGKFINSSTVSLVGIASYDCPSCKTSQSVFEDGATWTNIIPLDVLSTFFTLTSQVVMKTVNRG